VSGAPGEVGVAVYEAGVGGNWVPAEQRVFGLDRRTFGPAGFVLVVALLLIYGWQALDAAIPWHNEIRAGDVLDLGDGATAVPPVGWQLESGSLTGTGVTSATSLDVVLATGGATITMAGAGFDGSAGQFLDQVQRSEGEDQNQAAVSGSRATFTTTAGLIGVVESTGGPSGEELEAAFKMSARDADAAPALLVRVRTAPGQLTQYQSAVTQLLRSITPGAGR
jgi:hypothetical protein